MAQYETRSWVGWHHHMTLVGLAHLFVTLTRRASKKTPELTLDRTVRLLEAALEEPGLTLGLAVDWWITTSAEQGRQEVTRQDLAGQAHGRQIPAAVELDDRFRNSPPAPLAFGEIGARRMKQCSNNGDASRTRPGPADVAGVFWPVGVARTSGSPVYVHRYGCAFSWLSPSDAPTRLSDLQNSHH